MSLIGGLPNVQEAIDRQEREWLDNAVEKATNAGLNAYPIAGWGEGWFAVPSSTDLGWVYLTRIGWHAGMPQFCTCEARTRYCRHFGAAHSWWLRWRENDDKQRQADAEADITDIRERSKK